jgi:hypothetical protein
VLKDAAISGDTNVIKKVDKMILKCKYLITEIYNMWNTKEIVIPEIVGLLEPSQNHSDNT